MAIAGRGKDLVDLRMNLRVPLSVGGGTLAFLVIVVEIWASGVVAPLIEALGSMLMFALALGANILFVRAGLASRVNTPAQIPAPATEAPVRNDSELRGRLERAMADRFYARHGATLDDLASELRVPAHRLRRLINQGLGYRNFNQFLNAHRIAEASRRMLSESSPILTIALDVGFKSLSSFNTAFRAEHGMAPSVFRRHGTSTGSPPETA